MSGHPQICDSRNTARSSTMGKGFVPEKVRRILRHVIYVEAGTNLRRAQ